MRNFLDFGFSTITRELTHCIGSSTLLITPCDSMSFKVALYTTQKLDTVRQTLNSWYVITVELEMPKDSVQCMGKMSYVDEAKIITS